MNDFVVRIEGKKWSLWHYAGEITGNSGLDDAWIAVIDKASSQESVPQMIRSWEEIAWVELHSHTNTNLTQRRNGKCNLSNDEWMRE